MMVIRCQVLKLISLIAIIMGINIFPLHAEEIRDPIDVLKIFYEELLSDKSPAECEKIFNEPELTLSIIPKHKIEDAVPEWSATAKLWYFLRKNKAIFFYEYIPVEQILDKASISYVFSGVGKSQMVFEGILGIQLSAPVLRKHSQGIWKEIHFPFEKNETPFGERYLIDIGTISINGCCLDLADEFNRSGDFYEKLGLKEMR
ncbi:MAG: hypothetical protein HY810_05825 [Candidatus Omnitrophica bacterium]|nr:hypothetical protein [Candidatus Omnitrophota bacterium]